MSQMGCFHHISITHFQTQYYLDIFTCRGYRLKANLFISQNSSLFVQRSLNSSRTQLLLIEEMKEQSQQWFCTCKDENQNPLRLSNSQITQKSQSLKRNNSSPMFGKSTSNSFNKSFANNDKSPKNQTWSTYKESWTRFIHKPKPQCSVGMKHKPLIPYDSNHERSRLPVMLKVEKSRSSKKNTFQNFSMIKNRTIIRNTFQTMYQKSYKHPQILRTLKLKQQMIQ